MLKFRISLQKWRLLAQGPEIALYYPKLFVMNENASNLRVVAVFFHSSTFLVTLQINKTSISKLDT